MRASIERLSPAARPDKSRTSWLIRRGALFSSYNYKPGINRVGLLCWLLDAVRNKDFLLSHPWWMPVMEGHNAGTMSAQCKKDKAVPSVPFTKRAEVFSGAPRILLSHVVFRIHSTFLFIFSLTASHHLPIHTAVFYWAATMSQARWWPLSMHYLTAPSSITSIIISWMSTHKTSKS